MTKPKPGTQTPYHPYIEMIIHPNPTKLPFNYLVRVLALIPIETETPKTKLPSPYCEETQQEHKNRLPLGVTPTVTPFSLAQRNTTTKLRLPINFQCISIPHA